MTLKLEEYKLDLLGRRMMYWNRAMMLMYMRSGRDEQGAQRLVLTIRSNLVLSFERSLARLSLLHLSPFSVLLVVPLPPLGSIRAILLR